jgi:hypothetical protein
MFETVKTVAQFAPIIIAIVAVAALVMAFVSILVQRSTAQKRATIDFFFKTELDAHSYNPSRNFKRHIPNLRVHMARQDFKTSIEYTELWPFLDVCELIAVGVNHGVFHEEVAYRYWSDVLPHAYNRAKPLIDWIRADPDEGSAASYSEFEKLCDKWTRRSRS